MAQLTAALSDLDYEEVRNRAATSKISIMQWGGDVIRAALSHEGSGEDHAKALEDEVVALRNSCGYQVAEIENMTIHVKELEAKEAGLQERITYLSEELRAYDLVIHDLEMSRIKSVTIIEGKDELIEELRESRNKIDQLCNRLTATIENQRVIPASYPPVLETYQVKSRQWWQFWKFP